MKKHTAAGFVITLILAGTVLAAPPVGSVSSMGPVEIDGSQLSASTVPTWPIASGDEIKTTTHPAVIFLNDKSRITVDRNSKLRLKQIAGKVAVYLVEGSVFYSLVSNSSATFQVGQHELPVNGLSGTVSTAVATPDPSKLKFEASLITVSRVPRASNVDPF